VDPSPTQRQADVGVRKDEPRWFDSCETCEHEIPVEDEFDDQIGYEERARPVHVVLLDCGHDIVTELRR
jgi:hypothetical protein